jgi:flagellar biogenesis protein FliO
MTAKPMVLAAVVAAAVAAAAAASPAAPGTAAPAPAARQGREPAERPASSEGEYLPYSEPGMPETPGLLSVAGRVVGSLVLVIGLIFVTALVLRRYLGTTKAPTTSRKVSQLIEVTPLGGKRFLYLIRVADRLLVVGAGGERLSLLSEIRDPEVLEQVAALPRRSEFFDLFHRARPGNGERAAAEKAAADQAIAG